MNKNLFYLLEEFSGSDFLIESDLSVLELDFHVTHKRSVQKQMMKSRANDLRLSDRDDKIEEYEGVKSVHRVRSHGAAQTRLNRLYSSVFKPETFLLLYEIS